LVTSGSSLSSRLSASLGAVYLSLVIAGCVRDPLDVDCAALAAGDLVITELRGPQAEASSYRQWIEVYNARDEPVQLAGLRLVFTRNDGDTIALFVRDDLELAAGAYATLGGGDPGEFPYIDYDYTVDLHSASDPTRPSDLTGSAALTLETCGVVVDTVRYTLPESRHPRARRRRRPRRRRQRRHQGRVVQRPARGPEHRDRAARHPEGGQPAVRLILLPTLLAALTMALGCGQQLISATTGPPSSPASRTTRSAWSSAPSR
jgi:hypothetical protein